MGLHLIEAAFRNRGRLYCVAGILALGLLGATWTDPAFWANVVKAALGLGAVIFVHELGHFAVAKACGVKCEKFYLGFDIKGWKFCSFRWGETEYGIGVLPLGGYVKMLGQDDNPGKAAAEHERSLLQTGDLPLPTEESEAADAPLDPRSYLAQTVPERMAIISAGVIMNVIFAWVVLTIAYKLGVSESPAVISAVVPGEAAWHAGLKPGDQIIKIGEIEKPRYDDVRTVVSLGDIENGVPLLVQRMDQAEPISITVRPVKKGLAPRIGIVSSLTTTLGGKEPAEDRSPAKDKFEPHDRVVAVDGVELGNNDDAFARWQSILVEKSDQTLHLTVARRTGEPPAPNQPHPTKEVSVDLPPLPMRVAGITVGMGPLSAVQPESPAAAAGIKADDKLLAIDGQPPVDPLFLPEWCRRRAGQTLKLTIERQGESQPLEIDIEPREANYSDALENVDVTGVPALGIAYPLTLKIESVSDALKDKVTVGDEITAAQFILPATGVDDDERTKFAAVNKSLSKNPFTWHDCHSIMQFAPDGTLLELKFKSNKTASFVIVNADDWMQYARGLNFIPLFHVRKAETWGEASSIGWLRTKEFLSMVYRFIRKIFAGQVSVKGLGGPWTILQAAYYTAEAGFPEFLTFLAMLSANLAVVNFLPIPVLDGGHMVFLTYEAIRRKPPSEKIVIALSYLGLAMILSLMLWVLALDFGLISRR